MSSDISFIYVYLMNESYYFLWNFYPETKLLIIILIELWCMRIGHCLRKYSRFILICSSKILNLILISKLKFEFWLEYFVRSKMKRNLTLEVEKCITCRLLWYRIIIIVWSNIIICFALIRSSIISPLTLLINLKKNLCTIIIYRPIY
jgi:hypothetical protein